MVRQQVPSVVGPKLHNVVRLNAEQFAGLFVGDFLPKELGQVVHNVFPIPLCQPMCPPNFRFVLSVLVHFAQFNHKRHYGPFGWG
jgi:hypothetical protein